MSQSSIPIPDSALAPQQLKVEIVGVIDVGATAIRMVIAEIRSDGSIRSLETLSKAVALGRDTFTTRCITKRTIEECVTILGNCRKKINEYKIPKDKLRIIATSAVREAENRLSFLDRVFLATGFEVEVLDDAEVHRIMYLGITSNLKKEMTIPNQQTLILEVGGGNTEILLLNGSDVIFSHAYRVGALRIKETLEVYRAPDHSFRSLMENQIQHAFEKLPDIIDEKLPLKVIGLGGDIRFAAARLHTDIQPDQIVEVPVVSLENFTNRFSSFSVEELARIYKLSFQEAETLSPALISYVQICKLLKIKTIKIAPLNFRDGLLRDLAIGDHWSDELEQQVIRSALQLAHKYKVDEEHALHVAELSRMLYRQLADYHRLDPRQERILYVAALLHEVGYFISNQAYHKHSHYIISNSVLFGLSHQDIALVSLVARYHRRSAPKTTHSQFMNLPRDQRVMVAKLAAILRVAFAMNSSRNQRIHKFQCLKEKHRLLLLVDQMEDITNEQLAVRQVGSMFEDVYGMTIHLRQKPHNY
jgi:exopolyphosphatase/guanosine-5'-triphosphate,3'-diphosphate pyrophosphatase